MPQIDDFNSRYLFLIVLEIGQNNIKVLEDLVVGEGLFLVRQRKLWYPFFFV